MMGEFHHMWGPQKYRILATAFKACHVACAYPICMQEHLWRVVVRACHAGDDIKSQKPSQCINGMNRTNDMMM